MKSQLLLILYGTPDKLWILLTPKATWCQLFKAELCITYKFCNVLHDAVLRQERLYNTAATDIVTGEKISPLLPLIPHYACGVLNGLVLPHLVKNPVSGFCHCASSTCSASFKNVLVHRALEVSGQIWDQTCVYECVSLCASSLCVSLSFLFLHWGESASSESPSSFLTYTSPSALVPIIEMIVN